MAKARKPQSTQNSIEQTEQFEQLERTEQIGQVEKVVIRVTKGKTPCKVLVSWDETYNVPLIYAYCDFRTYQKVYKKIFDSKRMPENPAIGYCTTGRLNIEVDKAKNLFAVLVWANSSTPFELTLPTFMHEISHAADDILFDLHVEDKNGEAKAYLIEKEARKVISKLFGLPVPTVPTKMVADSIREIGGNMEVQSV